MTCNEFYTIALPLIAISAYASYRNYRIQHAWFKRYKDEHE